MTDIIAEIETAMEAGEMAKVYYTLIPRLIRMHDEGLIPVLPCKVGTIIFSIGGFYCTLCKKNHERIEPRPFEVSMLDDFGKTVFLTRESAENALKERET